MTIRAVRLKEGRDPILEDLLRFSLQRREILFISMHSHRRKQGQGKAHDGQGQQATANSCRSTGRKLLFGQRGACEAATDARAEIASSVKWKWVQGLVPWLVSGALGV